MKKILYTTFGMALLLGTAACQREEANQPAGRDLIFAPTVGEMTRTNGNDFFLPGDAIDINITTTTKAEQGYSYVYNTEGVFRGNPPFRFTTDDDYVTTLEAIWPANYDPDAPFVTDQRLLENYRRADRLKATGTINGIMPTEAPVPLHFERQNTMLEFELAGQNTVGLTIKSLLIELRDPQGEAQAYWAYCDTDNGHAELILPPDTRIQSTAGYLIGTLTIVPDDHYTIIFPQTDVTLEAGKRYLVTLTPQGYPMSIYAFIGGWNQGNDGIGIPFEQPTPDVDGTFRIQTPLQLITMSYLIRHYTDGTTFDWPTRTYVIDPGLAESMTSELAAKYIPLSAETYPGVQIVDTQDPAQPVTEITYGDNQTLSLFEQNTGQ